MSKKLIIEANQGYYYKIEITTSQEQILASFSKTDKDQKHYVFKISCKAENYLQACQLAMLLASPVLLSTLSSRQIERLGKDFYRFQVYNQPFSLSVFQTDSTIEELLDFKTEEMSSLRTVIESFHQLEEQNPDSWYLYDTQNLEYRLFELQLELDDKKERLREIFDQLLRNHDYFLKLDFFQV